MTTTAPTPWARSTIESGIEPYMIRDANGYAVADCRHYHSHHRADLNLDLIVRAVNCHADLLDACHEALNQFDLAARFAPRERLDGSSHSVYESLQSGRAIILAAIQKAEGIETPKADAA